MKKYAFRLCSKPDVHNYSECNSCQKKAIIICFYINFIMFVAQTIYGFLSNSASLLGEGAHNVGDAFVLATTVYLLASSQVVKARLALLKALLMFSFGLLPLFQVYETIMTQTVPAHLPITLLGVFALFGNIASTLLLLSYRDKDVNLKSAYICVRNDALGDLLVITAGLVVMFTGSYWPDVIAGLIITVVIIFSSIQIALESLGIINGKNKSY